MLSGKLATSIEFYERDAGLFSLSSVYEIEEGVLRIVGISDDFSTLVYSTMNKTINICKKKK